VYHTKLYLHIAALYANFVAAWLFFIDAFAVLHFIASKRLAAGKLVVIDATNVQPVESGLYMLLRFQKAAVRGNYETGNPAFSMHSIFLTIREITIRQP
jgi:hypothetical protein